MKIIDSIKWNKLLFSKHKHYLKSGLYVLHPCLRAYRRVSLTKNKGINLPRTRISGIKYYLLYFIRFFYIIVVWRKHSLFNGDVTYFSNNPIFEERDIKIFNLEQKKVFVKISSASIFNTFINTYNSICKLFPTPLLLESIERENEYIIEYIPNVDKEVISDSILEKLCSFYDGYYHSNKGREPNSDVASIMSSVGISLSFSNYHYREYFHHGDLSRDNFIISETGDVFFIDFDHVGYYPRYYDLFYYIINTYIYLGEDKMDVIHFIRYVGSFFQLQVNNVLYYFELYIAYFSLSHLTVVSPNSNYFRLFLLLKEKIKSSY